jgi:hypothetical protein
MPLSHLPLTGTSVPSIRISFLEVKSRQEGGFGSTAVQFLFRNSYAKETKSWYTIIVEQPVTKFSKIRAFMAENFT